MDENGVFMYANKDEIYKVGNGIAEFDNSIIDCEYLSQKNENEMVYVTTVVPNPKYRQDDRVTTDIYDNLNHKEVEDLCSALEGYVVHTDTVNSKKERLRKMLDNGEYEKYYRTIVKMLKQILKEYGKWK